MQFSLKGRRTCLLTRRISLILAFSLSSVTIGHVARGGLSTGTSDSAYINGTVITMDPDDNIAEAIAVKNGKIVAAASNQEILKLGGNDTKVFDLSGKVVLPGFYAAHDHLPGA